MKVKTKELRELSSDELVTRRRDLKHEMLNLRVQQQSGQLENPARIFIVRREVARIETILSSRRIQADQPESVTTEAQSAEAVAALETKTAAKKAPPKKTAAKKTAAKKTATKKKAVKEASADAE